MTAAPTINVLFADDIRHEMGGKISIVGAYGSEMWFHGPQPPTAIARLGIFLSVRWPHGCTPGPLDFIIRWTDPDQSLLGAMNIDFSGIPAEPRPNDDMPPGAFTAFPLEMIPAHPNEAIQVIHRHEGQERVVGRLFVRYAPPADAPALSTAAPPAPTKPKRRTKKTKPAA